MYKITTKLPSDHKIYQIHNTKYIPNGHEIYQHFPFKGPPKFTQSGIFGLKTYHLATLMEIIFCAFLMELCPQSCHKICPKFFVNYSRNSLPQDRPLVGKSLVAQKNHSFVLLILDIFVSPDIASRVTR
jgi:hypothetical protein